VISSDFKHSGSSSLHVVASSGGSHIENAVWQLTVPALVTNATYTLSYWYLPSTDGSGLLIRLSGSSPNAGDIYSLQNYAPPPVSSAIATPGGPNSSAASLPPFPPLWINEVEAANLSGATNRAGGRTPWIELYNPTTNSVPLAGLYLAGNYTNLTQWAFPDSAVAPGEFKLIFVDGQAGLSTAAEPHANFALPPGSGSVALSRIVNGQPQVIDYLDYTNLPPDRSYGSFPDGQSFDRREFSRVTPRAANDGSAPPLTVAINEWMASNGSILLDPVGGKFSDWFELYNYGTAPVNLAGAFLTDEPANKFKFLIPDGYVIPPGGYLLAWADKNSSDGQADLHVNFALAKSGGSIALYTPDGVQADLVAFGAQTTDVSQGRFPDGSANIVYMPPTPRGPNRAANSPPSLPALPDRSVYAGQTLSFAVVATDPDGATQTLSYSLDPGAPDGAAIDPASGVFSWTPNSGEAPGPYPVTVVATDNGVPPLSADKTFTITLLAEPRLGVGISSGTSVTLTWQSTPTARYRVEFSDDLASGIWNPAGGDQVGTGGLFSVQADLSATQQRFFRLVIL
jgi:hypothetical protein